MATILDGKRVAADVKQGLKNKIENLKEQGIFPGLAVILVGQDPASCIYAEMLGKAAQALGIVFKFERLSESVSQDQVITVIEKLNLDASVHGILPLMPLPQHINADKIAESILPSKDVDSIHPYNVGLVAMGKSNWAPCTPRAVMRILDYYGIDCKGKNAVIIGRSQVVGKPMLHLLLERDATVTVCHSRTTNLEAKVKAADILIAAAGRPGLVTKDMLKSDVVIADVGINEVDGKIVGDVNFDSAEKIASAITPVPGGVGSVSTAMVMEAVLRGF